MSLRTFARVFPLASLLALACRGAATTSSAPPIRAGTPAAGTPASPSVGVAEPIFSAAPPAADDPSGGPPSPLSPWAIELPSVTLAPPPPPDPAQYTRWRQRGIIPVGQSHLEVSRLSPDDAHLLVLSTMEFAVRIYERASGTLAHRHELTGYGLLDRADAVFWPESTRGLRFVLGGKDGITLRDAASGDILARHWDEPVWRIGWSLDEQVLVAERSFIPEQTSKLVFFLRGAGDTLRVVAEVASPQRVDGWAMSADNRLLVTLGYPTDRVELRRLDSGELVWSVPAPRYAGGVAISPDGAWVAAGGDHLLLVDARSPERRFEYRAFGNNIHAVAFSRSGDAVITSSYDGAVRIFRNDVGSGTLKLVRELRHAGAANVYDFSLLRDGSGLVSASGDQTVRWWGI